MRKILFLFIFLVSISKVSAQIPNPTFFKTGGVTNAAAPFATTSLHNQLLYLPADLGSPTSGTITKIYFRTINSRVAATLNGCVISLGQTSNTSFSPTTTFYTNATAGLTTVFAPANGYMISSPVAGGWFAIDLNTPFVYDNTKTLVVDISITSAASAVANGLGAAGGTAPASPNHKRLFNTVNATATGTASTGSWSDFGISFVDCTPSVLSLPLNESFSSTTTFAPSCWTRSNSTLPERNLVSAFGSGVGCVRWNYYDIPAATSPDEWNLVTPTFTAAPSNTKIKFDYSYSSASNSPGDGDLFEIWTSTTGGAPYTLLKSYDCYSELNTVGGIGSGSLFVPSSAQWATTAPLTLPVGTNKVKFVGISAFGNNFYFDNLNIETVAIPTCASTVSPLDLATNQFRNVTLGWSGTTGGPTGYDVYLSTVQSDVVNEVIGAKVATNQPGATFTPSPSLVANQTYYWKVIPQNINGMASGCSVQSFTTGPDLSYCTPVYSIGCGNGDITNVTFNTINNTTTCNVGAYTLYPAAFTTTSVNAGAAIPLSVTCSAACIISVWIDYNQNGIYESSEWTQVSNNSGGAGVVATKNINIPATALTGLTNMRIRTRFSGNANGPTLACASMGSGEGEDYQITLLAPLVDEAGISNIYTLGKLPTNYGSGHIIKALVRNNGGNSWTKNLSLAVSGANTFNDVQSVTLAPGVEQLISFAGFTPTVTGSETITISFPADNVSGDNSKSFVQDVTQNLFSFKENAAAITGVVGVGGAGGNFVAKLTTANRFGNPDTINEIKVDFGNPNTIPPYSGFSSVPFQYGIWAADGPGGVPGTQLYISAVQNTVAGQAFLPVPDVEVSGDFYVGLTESAGNFQFAYQTESPMRQGIFYYSLTATPSTWNDVSSSGAPTARLAIEAQMKVPVPPNCVNYQSPADLATACQTGTTLTWASGGGAPTSYDVYFGTTPSPAFVTNVPTTSYPTGALTPGQTYYWKIIAKNVDGDAIGCSVRSFNADVVSCYCNSTATNSANEYISGVSSGAFSNPSGSNLHSNFTQLGAINNVVIRTTFTVNVTITNPFDEDKIYIFCDFNHDNDFADPGELAGSFDPAGGTGTGSDTYPVVVTVPIDALNGITMMRIKMGDEVSTTQMNTDACQASFTYGEVEDYFVNIIVPVAVPNCDPVITLNSTCVTATTLTWTNATGFPYGYKITVYDDAVIPNYLAFDADLGYTNSYTFPTLNPNAIYHYSLVPYNNIGDAAGCATSTFTSGASQAVSPAVATNILPAVTYNFGAESVTPPALNCGITVENYDQAGNSSWYTSSIAPRTGSNHMRIDANDDNLTALDDYFFIVPINVTAGKVYRITWWDRASSASFTENYEVRMASLPDGSTMSGSAPDLFSTNSTTYAQKQATDYLVPINGSGTVYFGFHAISAAGQGSIYIDDIVVSEVPVPQINPLYCTTIPSMYDQIFVTPIPGATNYRFKIVGTGGQAGYNFEHYRNNSNPDYRLKWAPGVIYGYQYNVQVASFKNGVWSPYGPSCPVSLGAFPQIKLRNNPATIAGPCDYVISDLNDRILTDSLSGANDYMYRIVEDVPGGAYDYDFTWQRYSGNLDFRLLWAFQSSPLIDRVRFGYSYDVQTRALVGKTGVTYGNRPGEWGTYGSTCKLDLTAASPTTTLTNCNVSLTNLNDQFFIGGVTGAINYQYEFSAPGFTTATVYRGNGNLDFRMVWLAGVKYGTTFSVRVRAYVGGVWLNYGTPCTVITPAAPSTSVLGICGTTLSPGQFSSTIFCTAVPGASLYSYRITNVGGVPYSKVVYNYNSNNSFSLSRTLVCCGYQNMLPNATYTIEVAYYAGEWSAYGPVCTFTTGATVPRYSPFASEGVEAVEGALNLSVYPNPATVNQQFALELQGITAANEKVQVRIFNMIGDKVYSADVITKEEAILTIKPEMQLAAGVYMAEAQLNGNVYRVKFVVK